MIDLRTYIIAASEDEACLPTGGALTSNWLTEYRGKKGLNMTEHT